MRSVLGVRALVNLEADGLRSRRDSEGLDGRVADGLGDAVAEILVDGGEDRDYD